MNDLTIEKLRRDFKRVYFEEFDDPNETFMDYMLALISEDVLYNELEKDDYYYLFDDLENENENEE